MNCFKAYDIRGRVPDELNEDIAYRIGKAYAAYLKPSDIVIGRDIRHSSSFLAGALIKGLVDSGTNVRDIGICGTEEVYFSTFHYKMAGGIMITASHNPADYNGMKFVREDARPISGDTGLFKIKDLAEINEFETAGARGVIRQLDHCDDYVNHLLSYIKHQTLKPLKLVVNSGNGTAGHIIDLLEKKLPFEFIKINHIPDGNFPNGIPNPLLPENRYETSDAVRRNKADFGIAWDGDFDRCFFFDENGDFVEGYYIVGLLAHAMLASNPGQKIIHDPRLTWNTIDIVRKAGGVPVQSKTGHAFIKERMMQEDALYGGEMSAHHYFRNFGYCDSGMIPWLIVAKIMSESGRSLSELVGDGIKMYPASGEINRRLGDPSAALQLIEAHYEKECIAIDRTDGLGMEFQKWRFNLRSSNTEPLVRLNVESRADERLMRIKTEEILDILSGLEQSVS